MANTNQQHVQNGGLRCPNCNGDDVESIGTDGIEYDNDTMTDMIICNDCDWSWTDVYTLTGYKHLQK